MTTEKALANIAAARSRTRNFISAETLNSLNLELAKARGLYPGSGNLHARLQQQLEKFQLDISDPQLGEFELWSTCIVLMALIVRFVEEGDGRIFDGLKSPELESKLDQLQAMTDGTILGAG